MKKLLMFSLAAACLPLASCEFLRNWADAADPGVPAEPGVPGGVPDPSDPSHLPSVGGTDPLDLLVTVLTFLGLAPAARIVALARPIIAPLIVALLGNRKPKPVTPAVPPAAE